MLTDLEIRTTTAGEKPVKLSDSGGLYLLVKPNGAKLWQMAYRFFGRQKTLSFGPYPRVSLAAARAARDDAKDILSRGEDPSLQKKLLKIAGGEAREITFDKVADEFVARRRREGATEATLAKTAYLLKQARPDLGPRPIAEIQPAEVYAVLKRIEKSGRLETARNTRAICGRVFRYAIMTARATQDPCVSLAGSTMAPKTTHHASLFEPKEIGALIRAIRDYNGPKILSSTRDALQLMPLTFVRTMELRFAVWSEFDLDGATWSIPGPRMKMNLPHLVPLSRQAVAVLREMRARANPKIDLLFPGLRTSRRPISDVTINAALRRMGYATDEMTGHGFRRMASTILNERGFDRDWIERQLAHREPNKARRAYNAAQYLEQRAKMMQWWADHLDELAAGDAKRPKPVDADVDELIG